MYTETYTRHLPSGWYPATLRQITDMFNSWEVTSPSKAIVSCIVPHAGWAFSGSIAYHVLQSVEIDPDIVVIAGGHLLPGDPVHLWEYRTYETPIGSLAADSELTSRIKQLYDCRTDLSGDNSVEVQLPFIKHFFPDARVVCLRVPPDQLSLKIADELAAYSSQRKQSILMVGSADLTHYGPNYRFTPKQSTREALSWVKNTNDADLIRHALNYNAEEVLSHGMKMRSTCSAGTIACASEFARISNAVNSEIIEYATSYDIHPSDSFVGYAGIVYY